MAPEELLTIPQVAEVLRVTTGRAYELARLGVLPHVRLVRQVRVSKKQLDQFIERGGTTASTNKRIENL